MVQDYFPIPLAEAASWDMEAIERSAQELPPSKPVPPGALDLAPMVDIARDPAGEE